MIVAFILLGASSKSSTCTNRFNEPYSCSKAAGWAVGATVLLGLASLALAIWNYVFLLGRTGQSFGCRAVGIKVVDKFTGQPIGPGRAFVRYLVASVASGAICGLGYLWMLWDGEKQTWHDKVANSYVITT
jgi:uncharacterized RDD family membrane protein YckC